MSHGFALRRRASTTAATAGVLPLPPLLLRLPPPPPRSSPRQPPRPPPVPLPLGAHPSHGGNPVRGTSRGQARAIHVTLNIMAGAFVMLGLTFILVNKEYYGKSVLPHTTHSLVTTNPLSPRLASLRFEEPSSCGR